VWWLWDGLRHVSRKRWVSDGADGLFGKIVDQLDLLVGERSNLLAGDRDGADQPVVLEHGHVDYRSCAPKLGRHAGHGVRRSVDDVVDSPCLQQMMEPACRWRLKRPPPLLKFD